MTRCVRRGMQMYSCNGGANQKFTLDSSTQQLRSGSNNLCIDIDYGNGDLYVWAGPLSNGDFAAALTNTASTASNITLNFAKVPGMHGSYTVRDLWKQQDVGTFATSYTAAVAPHGTAMLRLRSA